MVGCPLCLCPSERSRSDETTQLSLLTDPIVILTGKKLDGRHWRRRTPIITQLRVGHQTVRIAELLILLCYSRYLVPSTCFGVSRNSFAYTYTLASHENIIMSRKQICGYNFSNLYWGSSMNTNLFWTPCESYDLSLPASRRHVTWHLLKGESALSHKILPFLLGRRADYGECREWTRLFL